jgi:hypothetical protein
MLLNLSGSVFDDGDGDDDYYRIYPMELFSEHMR